MNGQLLSETSNVGDLHGWSEQLEMRDIDQLDFRLIRQKLEDPEEGAGWSRSKCLEVEVEYKRFLALKRAYPDEEIVPNKDVDRFWHQHILDTQRYGKDCDQVFGYFVHHFPYFGMRGEEDYAQLCRAFERTQVLYKRHFGGPSAAQASRCRTQCKPVRCK